MHLESIYEDNISLFGCKQRLFFVVDSQKIRKVTTANSLQLPTDALLYQSQKVYSNIYIKIYTKILLRVSVYDRHLVLPCTQHIYLHGPDTVCCHTTAQYITTYFYRKFLTIVTLARLKYKLPDDGHRPKHVAAFYCKL